jgi:hypothetical protein
VALRATCDEDEHLTHTRGTQRWKGHGATTHCSGVNFWSFSPLGMVIGRRAEGFTSPNRTSAMALPTCKGHDAELVGSKQARLTSCPGMKFVTMEATAWERRVRAVRHRHCSGLNLRPGHDDGARHGQHGDCVGLRGCNRGDEGVQVVIQIQVLTVVSFGRRCPSKHHRYIRSFRDGSGGCNVFAINVSDAAATDFAHGALQGRHHARGRYAAAAAAVGEAVVGGAADECNLLPLLLEGKGRRFGAAGDGVLEQNGGGSGQLAGEIVVLDGCDVAGAAVEVGVIKQTHGEHLRENAKNCTSVSDSKMQRAAQSARTRVVHIRLVYVPGLHRRQQLGAHEVRARHLHVQASGDGGGVGGAPVRHHEARELHDMLEVAVKRGVVLACPGAVDLVVGAHEGANPGLDGAGEGRIVHFEARALVGVVAHGGSAQNWEGKHAGSGCGVEAGNRKRAGVSPVRFLVVESVVLGVGDHTLTLNAAHHRLHQRVSEERVFTREVFKVSAVLGNAGDADARPELHVGALARKLLAHGSAVRQRQLLVPRRSHSHGARPTG